MEFIDLPDSQLSRRIYNVQGFSCKVEDFVEEVKKFFPELKVEYKIDPIRSNKADSWPDELDDSLAKKDWNWNPEISNLNKFTERMIKDIKLLS